MIENNKVKENNLKWFKKTYDSIINRAKSRGLNKKLLYPTYYEKHHIIPRCLGGSDDIDNLVLLTYREHIICHELLTRIYPGVSSLYYSISLMLSLTVKNIDGTEKRVKSFSNSKKAEEYKLKAKELDKLSGKTKRLGEEYSKKYKGIQMVVLSEESKDKLSTSLTGKKKSRQHVENFKKSIQNNPTSFRSVINGEGMIFKTVKECSKYYNTTSTSIIRWISKGKFGLSYLDGTEPRRFNKFGIKCPDGTICESIKDCMKKYKRSEKTIKSWIKDPQKGFEYSLDHPIPKRLISPEEKEKRSESLKKSPKRTTKSVIGPDGTIYESVSMCSEKLGKDRHTIHRWITNFPEKGFKYL